jgi:hypothetical protein
LAANLAAHPGNLDSRSGHWNRKTSVYHFHTSTGEAVPNTSIHEKDWQKAFNEKVLHGELEHYVQGKRVDILTDEYAVEVDWLHKWQEGVSQALDYAQLTGKRPGLAIILEGERLDTKAYQACVKACRAKRIKLWVINNWVSVDDLSEILYEEIQEQ